jgi:hypothetical protein
MLQVAFYGATQIDVPGIPLPGIWLRSLGVRAEARCHAE